MGMYTELRGTVVFKTEDIAKAFAYGKVEPDWNQWLAVSALVDSQDVKDFIHYSRSTWIPNGDVDYQEGCVVQFTTELKNYDGTIGKFLDLIPEIADNWILEKRYEECSRYTLYKKGLPLIYVNGDNSADRDWCSPLPYEVYPDFDVFDLNNLEEN